MRTEHQLARRRRSGARPNSDKRASFQQSPPNNGRKLYRLLLLPTCRTMSSITIAVAPRLVLPQISRRLTSVRPRHFGTIPNASILHSQRPINDHASQWKRASLTPMGNAVCRSLDSQSRQQFSSTPIRPRDHHFDTLKFVQRLQDEGFTEEQAVAMMKVLSDVIEERYVQCPDVGLCFS